MRELRAQCDAARPKFPVCLRKVHRPSILDVAGFLLGKGAEEQGRGVRTDSRKRLTIRSAMALTGRY